MRPEVTNPSAERGQIGTGMRAGGLVPTKGSGWACGKLDSSGQIPSRLLLLSSDQIYFVSL